MGVLEIQMRSGLGTLWGATGEQNFLYALYHLPDFKLASLSTESGTPHRDECSSMSGLGTVMSTPMRARAPMALGVVPAATWWSSRELEVAKEQCCAASRR